MYRLIDSSSSELSIPAGIELMYFVFLSGKLSSSRSELRYSIDPIGPSVIVGYGRWRSWDKFDDGGSGDGYAYGLPGYVYRGVNSITSASSSSPSLNLRVLSHYY